jgi:LysR family nitrogen assimilation transcriptional regulator
MDLQHLQNFLTILDQRSISNAASLIRIAQPALSRQLRALEKQVGGPLLVRHGWGVSPTPAGEVLATHARDILNRVQAARDAVSAISSSPSGKLSVGVTGSVASVILPPLALEARRAMPGVKLALAEGSSANLHQRMLAGELDLAVIRAEGPLPALAAQLLLTEPVVVVGAAGMFRSGEAASIVQLLRHEALVTAPSGGLRLLYEKTIATAGANPPAFLEVDSFPALIELLAAGAGVSLLPYSTIHAGVQAGRLSWAPLAPKPLTRRLIVARPQDRIKTPAWRTADHLLRQIAAALAGAYGWSVQPEPPSPILAA